MATNEVEILKQKLQLLESENQRLKRQAVSGESAMTTETEVVVKLLPMTPLNGGNGTGTAAAPANLPVAPAYQIVMALTPNSLPAPPTHEGSSKTIKVTGGIEVIITARKETFNPFRNDYNAPHSSSSFYRYDDGFSPRRATFSVWCEVKSTEDCNALIIVKPSMKTESGCDLFDFCFTDYLQLSSSPIFTPKRRCREMEQSSESMLMQMHYAHALHLNSNSNEISLTLKVIRLPSIEEEIGVNDSTVTIEVENQKIEVDTGYLSKWSSFFNGYFAANMREKATGIYPIIMCSADDFRELLRVIYPSSKPIDNGNVKRMLEVADKFVMPELTRRCENYLCSTFSLTSIELIDMADQFNLYFTKTTVLERMRSTEQLRSEIIKDANYNTLSNDMKRDVDGRYVQLDVLDRAKKPRLSPW